MKLLRLKITDPQGFRSLQPGFEYQFRTEWDLQEEQGFAPFVCAGPNGSGKSNLLEVLAAIFFQLEMLRARRSFLPENFLFDAETNPDGFQDGDGIPNSFELEYLIRVPINFCSSTSPEFAEVKIIKLCGKSSQIAWLNQAEFKYDKIGEISDRERDFLLPQYVLGYSSGENEILSLPFFKTRFIQFDEYWHALKKQLSFPGRPETRLAYLDSGFSQAILLCNLLFNDKAAMAPFREDVGVDELKEFRIIIRRSIEVSPEVAEGFSEQGFGEGSFGRGSFGGKLNPALTFDEESGRYKVNLMKLLEADEKARQEATQEETSSYVKYGNFDPILTRFKRCATCWYEDEATDTLYLDYFVNEATSKAFLENFDFEVNQSPIALFQAFQVLLTLNLYSASEALKTELYQSDSHYVTETVPTLASDERIMRFKFVKFSKVGVDQPVMLKSLSDGEHQLLHSLGLCLLFKNTNSLFLLDEPETHFNPVWRSNFITRLHQCFKDSEDSHEMLITTHTPFLISDSKPEKVLMFNKVDGVVSVSKPEYNTLGASINKITMNTFDKRETIGGYAQTILNNLRQRFEAGDDKGQLIAEINQQLGDSVEKMLLIKTILDSMEAKD
ncbi:MAG: ABC transporter [Desulfotalea sp.]|nr:MAG: ABC transporter [Desulfotalea sp.]